MRIEDVSEDELGTILHFLAERERGYRRPVLVGGWAVFAFNPYSKSVDIDIVLSSRHRSSLLNWLRSERGYQKRTTDEGGWRGAFKAIPGVGVLRVDVGTFDEEYAFEGRAERLDLSMTLHHHEERVVAGVRARVPTRSLLLLYKLKAAWDRALRLAEARSPDPAWEMGKLVKDRSDVLALLAPGVPSTWDLAFLREELLRCDFLQGVLQEATRDEAARERYRGVAEDAAEGWALDLLGMLGLPSGRR